jgi:hypothetical protein
MSVIRLVSPYFMALKTIPLVFVIIRRKNVKISFAIYYLL